MARRAALLIAATAAVAAALVSTASAAGQTVAWYRTARDTSDQMTAQPTFTLNAGAGSDAAAGNVLVVNATQRFQKIFGFGGAFTEAAAINFAELSPSLQQQVLELYWGATGIGYSVGRVPINSCDFSPASYSFDNVTGDMNLMQFDNNVSHDTITMIPFIKAAMKKTVRPIRLFASPWSPPAWMKINNNMTGSATPVGLKSTCRASWALYFSKFLTAYKTHGVAFWGITVQNEPEFAAPWEACVYTAESESEFVRDYLGPQLRRDHPEVAIMAYDHNRDDVAKWMGVMYSDEETAGYVNGTAVHWYVTNNFANLDKTYELNPNKFILATEGCNGPGVAFGNWPRAESYGYDMITDLEHYVAGWTDWNLMLDMRGGPNHLDNFCDAHLIADAVKQQLHIQPSYYVFGQLSRWVEPDSVRVGRTLSVQYDPSQAMGANLNDGDYLSVAVCDGGARQKWDVLTVRNSTFCADVADKSTADGAFVQVWTCYANSPNQQWKYNADTMELVNNGSSKCLYVDYAGKSLPSPAAATYIRTCDGAADQKWSYDAASGQVKHAASGLCLNPRGPFVQATAVQTAAGGMVAVVMNEGDISVDVQLTDASSGNSATVTIFEHSIQTFTWGA